MKYIRTKDGEIWEVENPKPHSIILCVPKHKQMLVAVDNKKYEMRNIQINLSIGKSYWKTDIVAKADTIEELCDEFVIHNPNNDGDFFPKYFVYKNNVKDLFKESMIKYQKEKNIETFASIWLENGTLKSVAKLKGILPNGEIDWELL